LAGLQDRRIPSAVFPIVSRARCEFSSGFEARISHRIEGTGRIEQNDGNHLPRIVAGEVLGVEPSQGVPHQHDRLADVQTFEELPEICRRRLCGDGFWRQGRASPIPSPVIGEDPGQTVEGLHERRRPRLHVVAESRQQHQQRVRARIAAVTQVSCHLARRCMLRVGAWLRLCHAFGSNVRPTANSRSNQKLAGLTVTLPPRWTSGSRRTNMSGVDCTGHHFTCQLLDFYT
jgi:hypothetical protein